MPDTIFRQEGDIIDRVFAADVKAGALVYTGTICGQVTNDVVVATNPLGALRVKGVIRVTKASATVFAAGAAVNYDTATKLGVTTGGAGPAGKAIADAPAGQLYVDVLLNA